MKKLAFLFLLSFTATLFAQNTTIIKGFVTNKQNSPVENVSVSYLNKGTTTNEKGYYELSIPIRKTIQLVFSHVSYQNHLKKVTLRSNRILEYSPVLVALNQKLNEVIVKKQFEYC